MIVKDMQPANVVEDKGFCRLLSMRSLLPERYQSVKCIVLEELAEIQACSLTCDFWTARTSKSYITVTCHFIDDSWKMKAYVLATNHVEVSHTAEIVAQ